MEGPQRSVSMQQEVSLDINGEFCKEMPLAYITAKYDLPAFRSDSFGCKGDVIPTRSVSEPITASNSTSPSG